MSYMDEENRKTQMTDISIENEDITAILQKCKRLF